MAKKKSARKSPSVAQRLDTIERLVRSGFHQVDQRFRQVDKRFEQVDRRLDILDLGQRDLRSEMNEKLALIDERINLLANHVDGFMKLHETLDIEFKVMKEQMSRLEARLNRLEAERTT